jgi:hypothetical protein
MPMRGSQTAGARASQAEKGREGSGRKGLSDCIFDAGDTFVRQGKVSGCLFWKGWDHRSQGD